MWVTTVYLPKVSHLSTIPKGRMHGWVGCTPVPRPGFEPQAHRLIVKDANHCTTEALGGMGQ